MDEETVDLEACEKCTCKSNALTCCGIGYSAGTVHPPEGCFKKNLENCCYQFVQQANDAVSCGEKVCPET
ncbi:hypothetical protein SNE40_001517 [Patella caerulea]|uniref:Uncharacterized protein n=1 Tax=Patella caerulea TaxID=87958 RepID=A0AAN8KNB5_PATCE